MPPFIVQPPVLQLTYPCLSSNNLLPLSSMNYILFDDHRQDLLPLTFTRPVAEIRIGILTIREKWERYLGVGCTDLTEDYLSAKFPTEYTIDEDNVWINGSFCPNAKLAEEIAVLCPGQELMTGEVLIARNTGDEKVLAAAGIKNGTYEKFESHAKAVQVCSPWDIFSKNGDQLRADFELITKGRTSHALSRTNQVMGVENIFVEEGAKVECAILNAAAGPIYIGKDAEIMEGSIVRGPFSLGEHSTLKMGAKVYGDTTIGPHCKVGGEVTNSVIFGYSNKAHDGYLGNSVIGEWCNLGADSNNSNLKNNYAEVKVWHYEKQKFVSTGLTFCGLIMGDHSKCGINTMFNTGTVVGVSANIFGAGFPRNFVADFSWGGASGFTTYKLETAFETADLVFKRRGLVFDDTEKAILTKVFELTEKFRK
jgi:UDP-N-acetylglucosamine diphosphorylase/glucosamine-1-phosphate N-acetyltransferase